MIEVSLLFFIRKRGGFRYSPLSSFTKVMESTLSLYQTTLAALVFFVVPVLSFSSLLLFFVFPLRLFAIVFCSQPLVLVITGMLFELDLHLLFHDIPEHRRRNLTPSWNIMLAICFIISYPNRTY